MWEKLIKMFEKVGRARAATEMVRQGRPDLARKIMLGEGAF